MTGSLIEKYNVEGPRYTSYPTVPYWQEEDINPDLWKRFVRDSFHASNQKEGISLYIHLPFCESLCTFCGCHKRITRRHEVEAPYITDLLTEWQMYCALFPSKPKIREIHLGGGTPTFFSADHLVALIEGIFSRAERHPQAEFSFEGHPNNTSEEHICRLYQCGFTRSSFGVQDYDPVVQKAINRHQSFESVKRVTDISRDVGYKSISHDLVFGLPFQAEEGIKRTVEVTSLLNPDRISLYSYAHVPWIKGVGQRGFDEKSLPSAQEKRRLYETSRDLLLDHGYREVGMDHFVRETDSLWHSVLNGTLHRNFMGYSTGRTQLMIGLGASAISDSWTAFAQNIKNVEEYSQVVRSGRLPVFRGHFLTETDLKIRWHILNIMCRFTTSWNEREKEFAELSQCLERLKPMVEDGLVELQDNGLVVPENARGFVRNVCMAFDLRLHQKVMERPVFSKTI